MPASLGPRLRTAGGAKWRRGGQTKLRRATEATMVEEFEEPKKLGLAAAIAQGISIRSWASKNDVPKTTACRWALEPQVKIEAQKIRRRMLDRIAGAMTKRGAFALSGIIRLANEAQSESVQLNAFKTILTDAMRIARYADLETRMAEFEEKLRRDPQCFSPLPRR